MPHPILIASILCASAGLPGQDTLSPPTSQPEIASPPVAAPEGAPDAGSSLAPLSLESLPAWHEFIRPSAEELIWGDIPWRNSFWRAVMDAQESRKPILLWTMNGHPMGCT